MHTVYLDAATREDVVSLRALLTEPIRGSWTLAAPPRLSLRDDVALACPRPRSERISVADNDGRPAIDRLCSLEIAI